jgi:ribonuclease PH
MSDDDLIEIQVCGERRPFSNGEFNQLIGLAQKARTELIEKQRLVLGL